MMKRTAKILLAAMTLSTLSACAVYTPAGSVVIGDGGGYGGGPGTFCPPGQAKKGRC